MSEPTADERAKWDEEDAFHDSYESAEAELIKTLERVRRHKKSQEDARADFIEQLEICDLFIAEDAAAEAALVATLAAKPFEWPREPYTAPAEVVETSDEAEAVEVAVAYEPVVEPDMGIPITDAASEESAEVKALRAEIEVAAAAVEPMAVEPEPETAAAPQVEEHVVGSIEPGVCVVNFGKAPDDWPNKDEAPASASVIAEAAQLIEEALPELWAKAELGELGAVQVIAHTGLTAHRVYRALHELSERGAIQYVQRLDRNQLVILPLGAELPTPEVTDNQDECLRVMKTFADADGRVEISFQKIASASCKDLAAGSVSMILDALKRKGIISVIHPGSNQKPGTYQIVRAPEGPAPKRKPPRDVTALLMGDPAPDRPRA